MKIIDNLEETVETKSKSWLEGKGFYENRKNNLWRS